MRSTYITQKEKVLIALCGAVFCIAVVTIGAWNAGYGKAISDLASKNDVLHF